MRARLASPLFFEKGSQVDDFTRGEMDLEILEGPRDHKDPGDMILPGLNPACLACHGDRGQHLDRSARRQQDRFVPLSGFRRDLDGETFEIFLISG